jgi:hypothetical protein
MRGWVAFFGGCAVAVACGSTATNGTTGIHASDFDQSCTTVSDCISINEGTGCCLACQYAAINKADSAKYQAKVKELQSSCTTAKCAQPPCAAPQLGCTAGKCTSCVGACGPMDAGGGDAQSDAATDASLDGASDAAKD